MKKTGHHSFELALGSTQVFSSSFHPSGVKFQILWIDFSVNMLTDLSTLCMMIFSVS